MALLKHRLAILVCVCISIIRAQSSPDAVVVFNEIHYNPSGNDEKGEWVELFNQMGIMTDVSGWKIEGIGFTIPENTFINPGEYLVIAKNQALTNSVRSLETSITLGKHSGYSTKAIA